MRWTWFLDIITGSQRVSIGLILNLGNPTIDGKICGGYKVLLVMIDGPQRKIKIGDTGCWICENRHSATMAKENTD